jgi:GntR family transcriptional regulator
MIEQISRQSHKPIYIQICDIIREKVNSGEMLPGSRVWSEKDIISKFQVSRNTARKAIETLSNEGIVDRIQGKGSFVTQSKVEYGLQFLTSFSEEAILKGLKPSSKVICFTRIHPTELIAEKLSIPIEAWVYKLERLRYVDGCPICHQLTYIPEEICPNLSRFDFSKDSLYKIIEQVYKHKLAKQDMNIKPILASEQNVNYLQAELNTPLLKIESTTYLSGGTPIEYGINVYLSERYVFNVLSYRRPKDETTSEEE